MKLSEIKIHQSARIMQLFTPLLATKIRLLEMGFTPGTMVVMQKKAPLGDPIGIALRGYELCISKRQASYILVEVVK